VENHTLLVHINNNKEIRLITGYYLPNILVDTIPKTSGSIAIAAAKKLLKPKSELKGTPESELVVYYFNDKPYLTWKIRINSEDPLGVFIYYIDAITGNILDSYNDFKSSLNRTMYTANHGTSLPGTLVRSEGEPPVSDDTINVPYDHFGISYAYYQQKFNRDGYDNMGSPIIVIVHYGKKYNNAGWSPSQKLFVFGDGDGTRFAPLGNSLDVVAHEYTHGITDTESALVYRDQPGALNESLSDIFGCLIDADDWMLADDVYTPGTPGDALRYLSDPPLGGQPDHMDNYSYGGDVHTNSGIPNKAAYLISEGGTHHGITVTGIGRDNMAKIFYSAQTDYLQSMDNFYKARLATIDATINVFGAGDVAKQNTVRQAWNSVGVGPFGIIPHPEELRISKDESEQFVIEVLSDQNPVANANVTFVSENTGLATVSPSSGNTDTNGKITATVTSTTTSCLLKTTLVTVTATYGPDSTLSKVVVKVPATSDFGLIMILLCLVTISLYTLKKFQVQVNSQIP
jgi:thermolysin